ncbi:hypothetical protein Pmani_005994 [Petrolisthes manimaculis]|uniref:Uncharacterized protein n=1 Tax=Petrolisthes manimaculis TaxID=1843537 RepID=A0AAE1QB56_9EUCA|nr:hypothetical protein Pmani_005994 [Petrolisthes manimaculis]
MLVERTSIESSHKFIQDLALRMRQIDFLSLSTGSDHSLQRPFIPADLSHCTHVWLRRDRVRRSLEAPYVGPLRVLRRTDKYFTLELPSGAHETVSIDRLKPAYIPQGTSELVASPSSTSDETCDLPNMPPRDITHTPMPTKTRSGRTVRMKTDPEYIYY